MTRHKKMLGFCLAIPLCISAQITNSQIGTRQYFINGYNAFQNKDYVLAKSLFTKQSKNNASLDFENRHYLLLTKLMLNENNADEAVKLYLSQHPNEVLNNNLKLALGDYYFRNKKIVAAKETYLLVNKKMLSAQDEQEYNFKLGFLYYSIQDFINAKKYLLPLVNNPKYTHQANYYLGNISLQNKDYEQALVSFDKIKDEPSYKKELDYQRLVILFQTKKYQQAIDLGLGLYKGANRKEQSDFSKIIGESYFYLQDYTNAVTYLEQYDTRKQTAVDNYYHGYAYYMTGNYQKAIEKFNKIVDGNNLIAQTAYYHLADAYVRQDLKSEALNAFKNASEMNFDIKIQQDALLNYAKLSYEIGNPYVTSTSVLENYVAKYPTSKETKTVESLIINTFFQYKDYLGVINYYNKNNIPQDDKYQLALLELGYDAYYNNKNEDALKYFTEVSGKYYNKVYELKGLFWKAETAQILQKNEEAIYSYQQFLNNSESSALNEYVLAYYGLGYAYFTQKKYNLAKPFFEKYIPIAKDDVKKHNAILRFADCLFVEKNYQEAINNYNKVIQEKSANTDYAWYQKALSYGFLNQDQQKEIALQTILKEYTKSAYLDKSYFQLANLYLKENQTEKAIKNYDILTTDFPKSPLVSKALLKKGLILFNKGENENAINIFKKVVHDFAGTADAVQAVKSAEQVYKEIDEVDAYATWVKQLEFINISDTEIDKSMFSAAESKYLEGNYENAITSFKKYIINFPAGMYALTANFYLAQSYVNTKKATLAIPHYQEVLKANDHEFTEVALNKLAVIFLENEQWENALPLLLKLDNANYSYQNMVFAQGNLMKYYYLHQNNSKVITYVHKVLNNAKSNDVVILDAYLYGARASVAEKNFETAKKYYKILEKAGRPPVIAEAYYYKAFFLNQEKNYKASNTEIQKLASNYQQYKEWGIKGLLIMATNYHELKDDFQANYILKNVIENSSEYPKIQKEAKVLSANYNHLNQQKNNEFADPLNQF